jgi:hypothetical protein
MSMRGPHGITVDAFRGHVIATSAFDGVIQAEEHDTSGDEQSYSEPEEQPAGSKRRPDGAIEDTMRRLKRGVCTEAHDPENRRHRPLTWSQDGTGQQDFHRLPNGARKDRGKDAHDTAEGDRQGEHDYPFG